MKFYYDKFKLLRKTQGITTSHLCNKMNICRATLWAWEMGKRTPKREDVYLLSSILKIPVENISDLSPLTFNRLDEGQSSPLNYCRELPGLYASEYYASADKAINHINFMISTFNGSTIIINALLKTLPCMFYVKNTELQYVTANYAFLEALSLPLLYVIRGRSDADLFSIREAKINTEQDRKVLLTGNPLLKTEGFIPGTQNKKWGIISKLPILDSQNKFVGLIGLFIDITERKKEEKRSKILEAGINFITDALAVVNEDKKTYIYLNKMHEYLYGYPNEIFMEKGCNFWLDECIHPDDREEQEQILHLEIPCPIIRKFKIVLPDKRIRLIEARISTQTILDYKSNYRITINRDLGFIED